VVIATNAEKLAHQDQILKMVRPNRVRGAKTIVAAYPRGITFQSYILEMASGLKSNLVALAPYAGKVASTFVRITIFCPGSGGFCARMERIFVKLFSDGFWTVFVFLR
jgi:hypothetical protein